MSTVIDQLKNLLPFVLSLPDDDIKYHDILKSTQSVTMQSGLVSLQPGQDVGSHTTGKHEELLIILDGIGEVELEGLGRQRIQKGCVAYIPPATQHNVFNVGIYPLRYLWIVSRVQ
ncbi:MAG: cupin domain-containing protein [Candidatus Edwardsbacteria bacterium]